MSDIATSLKIQAAFHEKAMAAGQVVHLAVHMQNGYLSSNPFEFREREILYDRYKQDVATRISGFSSVCAQNGITNFFALHDHALFSESQKELFIEVPKGETDIVFRTEHENAMVDLKKMLEQKNVKTLIVSGAYLSRCITKTCKEAVQADMGLDVYVPYELILKEKDGYDLMRQSAQELAGTGANICSVKEILQKMRIGNKQIPSVLQAGIDGREWYVPFDQECETGAIMPA